MHLRTKRSKSNPKDDYNTSAISFQIIVLHPFSSVFKPKISNNAKRPYTRRETFQLYFQFSASHRPFFIFDHVRDGQENQWFEIGAQKLEHIHSHSSLSQLKYNGRSQMNQSAYRRHHLTSLKFKYFLSNLLSQTTPTHSGLFCFLGENPSQTNYLPFSFKPQNLTKKQIIHSTFRSKK